MSDSKPCPCGSGSDYAQCCGPVISGQAPAQTAEALMRSRYSAYVKGEIDYIEKSLAPEKRKRFDHEGAAQWSEAAQWKGLTIHSAEGGEGDDVGFVDFTAAFEMQGELEEHREKSKFRREKGEWVYVDGEIVGQTYRRETPKVGRNEPCPCGSGKKFKKCCG